MATPTPVERVIREGGSSALVKWVGRVQQHAPAIAPFVGLWASVYARFARHRGPVLAGGLAFFALLSLVPAVLSLGAVIALILGSLQFMADLSAIPESDDPFATWFSSVLVNAVDSGPTDLRSVGLAGAVGFVVTLYAASRFVYVTRQVLDVTLELEPEPPSVLWRVTALGLTLLLHLGIVASIVVLTVVPRLLAHFGLDDLYVSLLQLFQLPILMCLAYLALTVMLRFGTRVKRVVPWLNLGALMGTLIAAVGTFGLGWFLTVSTTYSTVVATLGSVIALELWLFVICTGIVVAAETEGIRSGFVRRDPSGRTAQAASGGTGSGTSGAAPTI